MNIPLLQANDIECRIQSVSKNRNGEVGAILLLYKNARVDMRILDEVFGADNWQRKHEFFNDNLYCSVGVRFERGNGTSEWVWKEDVGVPSNTESEKGQASDAFKRACTNWGIGRELYTAPFIYVKLTDGEWYESNGKIKASSSAKFFVDKIEYNDRREIVGLVIKDARGGIAYSTGGKYKAPKEVHLENSKPVESPKSPSELICEFCGKPITAHGKFSAQQIADTSLEKYGHRYCFEHAKMEKERLEKMNKELDAMTAEYKGAIGAN